MAHTPGPWQACSCGKCGQVWSVPADLQIITVHQDCEDGVLTDEQWCDNVALVAAAPDLLVACKAALETMSESARMTYAYDAYQMLTAAIAKAEGK